MSRFHTITSPNPDYGPRGTRNPDYIDLDFVDVNDPDYDPDAYDPDQPEFLVEPDLRKLIVEDVLFTPEEEAQRDAEEAKHLNDKPRRQWLREMAEATITMSDGLEELWDAVGLINASQETKDAHAIKKAVRADKPG